MVVITFFDDAGNEESRTSDPPRLVGPPIPVPASDNVPATGAPAVGGSPLVGQVLAVTTSDIADENGITSAVFAYQWKRIDPGSADTEGVAIPGATGHTYTVATVDFGHSLRVVVTFTDDEGNEESLSSALTEAAAFDAGDGQTVLASALVQVGDRGRKDNNSRDPAWYATETNDWYASGTLEKGSLTWNGMRLNRVAYFENTDVLRFNNGDGSHIGESFATGGANRELTIWVRTETQTVSFQARLHIANSGAHWINFTVPDGIRATLDGIATGHRIIIAVSAPDTS